MLLALPLVALTSCIFAVRATRRYSWREATIRGAVIWTVTLVVLTEASSVIHALDRFVLGTGWLIVTICAGAYALRRGLDRSARPRVPLLDVLPLAAVGLLLGLVGWTGALSEPNNWDSQTYHLARVAHWLQDSSVAHFATANVRQIDQPPLAEYIVTHLIALAGTDRVAFLAQWLALVGCCVTTSHITAQLGGDRRSQILAVVVTATAPMALLQASSTQNDLVAAFFVLAAYSLALEARRAPPIEVLVPLGAVVGLALLTKGTVLVLLPAPVVYALWQYRSCLRRAAVPALTAAAIGLAVIAPHFGRNLATFDGLVSPETAAMQTITDPGPAALASNIVRNAAIQLASRHAGVNDRMIVRPAISLHDAVGLDPNDPRWTFLAQPFQVTTLTTHEDLASNPIHVALGALAVIAALVDRVLRRRCGVYAAFVALGFLLFSAAFRWQPWGTRLMVPIVAASAPLVAIVLREKVPRIVPVVAGALVLAALPAVLSNDLRPLGGGGTYFAAQPLVASSYRHAALAAAERCDTIGLDLGGDSFEYPLWQLVDDDVRFHHVDVANSTGHLADAQPVCAVISTEEHGSHLLTNGATLERTWSDAFLSVYRAQP